MRFVPNYSIATAASSRRPTTLRRSELLAYSAAIALAFGGLVTLFGPQTIHEGVPDAASYLFASSPEAALCLLLIASGLFATIRCRISHAYGLGITLFVIGSALSCVQVASTTASPPAPVTTLPSSVGFALDGLALILLARPVRRRNGLLAVAGIATLIVSIGSISLFGNSMGLQDQLFRQPFLRMSSAMSVYTCIAGIGVSAIVWRRAKATSHELVVMSGLLTMVALLLLFFGIDAAVLLDVNESVQTRVEIASFFAKIKSIQAEVAIVRQAETAQRGYLLTKDESYLGDYRKAIAQINVAPNDSPQGASPDTRPFRSVVADKLQELNLTIAMGKSGDFEHAISYVATGSGRRLMAQLDQEAAHLIAAYQSPLAARQSAYQASVRFIKRTILIAFGIGFLLVICAVTLVVKEIRRRSQAESSLRQNEAVLEQRILDRTQMLANRTNALTEEIEVRQKLDLELKQFERRLNTALDLAQVAVWTWNAGEEHVQWSGPVQQVLGLSDRALSSYSLFRDLVHPDDRSLLDAKLATCLEHGIPYEAEFRIVKPDGVVRWVAGLGSVFCDGNSSKPKMAGVNFDITARKEADNALIRSQTRYRAMLEQSPIAIHVLDFEGNTISVNPAFEKQFNVNSNQMAGFNIWQDPQLDSNNVRAQLERSYAGEVTYSGPIKHDASISVGKGSAAWIEVTCYPVKSDDGAVQEMVLLSHDVSERELAQIAVRESERHFRELLKWLPQIVWTASSKGELTYHNDRWYEFAGIGRDQETQAAWLSIVHPDDVQQCAKLWANAMSSEVAFESECRLWDRKNSEYRWHLNRTVPFFTSDKRLEHWIGTCTDIHEQKMRKELLENEVHLRTSALQQALAEKNTLLKEVHHRVKNNLQIISSLLRMQRSLLQDEVARAALQESQERVLSMALIHERLYGNITMDRIAFQEYTAALVQELMFSYGAQTRNIYSRLSLSPVTLAIDQAIPCGLILNELITNALKYAYPEARAGEIRVSLKQTLSGEVVLNVSDDGVGLPENFDQRNSKSLGLSIIQILAKQLGGTLQVSSQSGAEFEIRFLNQYVGQLVA